MSLILYPPDEMSFDTNGIGILSDAKDAEVHEVLNSLFELTVQYPVSGLHFDGIVPDAYITAPPNPVDRPQPFRIYRITKPMRGVVTVYARHAAYKNRKITVEPFTAFGADEALQGLKNHAVNESPFSFWTDVATEGMLQVKIPTDAWRVMGSDEGAILDVFGGEYKFDLWEICLLQRRGADRGVAIRYGKNLTDLTQDENIADMFTGVCPFWTQSDGDLMMLPEKIRSGPGIYAEAKIMPLDVSQEFDEKPTEEQLRAYADRYIERNGIGIPEVSWTVEFAHPEQSEEYGGIALLEQVLLGDTVSVFFPKLNVNATARAVAARYRPLLGRYKNITLGSIVPNLARTLASSNKTIRQNKAESKSYTDSTVRHAVDTLVAKTLLSILENSRLRIDGAAMELFTGDKLTVSLSNEFDGSPILYMHDLEEGEQVDSCELSPHHLKLGGTSLVPKLYLSASGEGIKLWLNGEENGKTLDWKPNGDGTYTLIGR